MVERSRERVETKWHDKITERISAVPDAVASRRGIEKEEKKKGTEKRRVGEGEGGGGTTRFIGRFVARRNYWLPRTSVANDCFYPPSSLFFFFFSTLSLSLSLPLPLSNYLSLSLSLSLSLFLSLSLSIYLSLFLRSLSRSLEIEAPRLIYLE
jgi:hypothetical protein